MNVSFIDCNGYKSMHILQITITYTYNNNIYIVHKKIRIKKLLLAKLKLVFVEAYNAYFIPSIKKKYLDL